jgi:hypothetical protein
MGLTQRPFACSFGISAGKVRHRLCLVAGTRPVNRGRGLGPHRNLGTWQRVSRHPRLGGGIGPDHGATSAGHAIGPGLARRAPPGTSSTSSRCSRKGRRMAGRSRPVSLLPLGGACCPRAAPFLSEPAHASQQQHRPRPASGCRQARRARQDHVPERSPCAANTAAGQRWRGGAPAIDSRGRASPRACGRGEMRIRPPASQAALPSRVW